MGIGLRIGRGMLQTNHTAYVANDNRLRYKRIGRWRDPSAGSSTARAAAPPCGALCTPRKGLLRLEAAPPAIARPRHAEPISEGGYIGAIRLPGSFHRL